MISTEFTGILSNGGGMGLQARYTQKINNQLKFDTGLGIGGGERNSRLFAGLDYEIFPDYQNQPRFSLKASYENAKEFNNRYNIFSIAPTISKGFSFWGKEAYPFFTLPVGISLNENSKKYETIINASFGWTGKLPIKGYDHLTTSVEASLNLKNSWGGVFVGLSYPLN